MLNQGDYCRGYFQPNLASLIRYWRLFYLQFATLITIVINVKGWILRRKFWLNSIINNQPNRN